MLGICTSSTELDRHLSALSFPHSPYPQWIVSVLVPHLPITTVHVMYIHTLDYDYTCTSREMRCEGGGFNAAARPMEGPAWHWHEWHHPQRLGGILSLTLSDFCRAPPAQPHRGRS
jgi:hypothetical protein